MNNEHCTEYYTAILKCNTSLFYLREGCRKKMREKYGLLPNLPRTPPRVWSFFPKKNWPPFFCWKFHLQWPKRILVKKKFWPKFWPKFSGHRALRIWAVRATFKAVLMAVDKTYALQTKCKTCFGGPRMILQAHWKNTFSKKQFGFFTTLWGPIWSPLWKI